MTLRIPAFFSTEHRLYIFEERAFGQRFYTQVTRGVRRRDHVPFQSVLSRAWDFLETLKFLQKKPEGVETPQWKYRKQIEHFWLWNELKHRGEHVGTMNREECRKTRKNANNTTRFCQFIVCLLDFGTMPWTLKQNTTAVLKNADL